jgi:hypothetical protein
MPDEKPIPTLDDIYAAARAEELQKRAADLAQQNTPPPAAPVAPIGEVKPLVRFGDMFPGGTK